MSLNLERPLVFFDLETTGASISTDRIIDIFMLKINPDQSRTTWMSRINPGMPIKPEATEVHGITDADVKDQPSFAALAPKIEQFFEDADIAGYNSNYFDIPLLMEEFYRVGIYFDISKKKTIDVFKIFSKMERRDLSAAYKFYCNQSHIDAHSAEADVMATYQILEAQLERYAGEIKNDTTFLHEFTTDTELVDMGRRLINENGIIKYNFGKYKGMSVIEVFSKDPSYYHWIIRGDFHIDTKKKLQQIKEEHDKKNG